MIFEVDLEILQRIMEITVAIEANRDHQEHIMMEQALNESMNYVPPTKPISSTDNLKCVQYSNTDCSSKECGICLDEYTNTDEVWLCQCSHYFHKGCLDTWIKTQNTCPVCRDELDKCEEGKENE